MIPVRSASPKHRSAWNGLAIAVSATYLHEGCWKRRSGPELKTSDSEDLGLIGVGFALGLSR